jgi:hypothetical protein
MSTIRERLIWLRDGFLTLQADELREMAVNLSVSGVCTDDLPKLYAMLREAADTIESLRDRLHESYGQVPEQGECENDCERESYSRWNQLFGTPERAARTLAVGDRHADCGECAIYEACYSSDMGCLVEEPDALLEWLRGDAK